MQDVERDEPELYIGLMTGTSLDGVDAVLADLAGRRPRLLGHAHHDFAAELRSELLALNTSGADELHRSAVAAQHLARACASAVEEALLHAGVEPSSVLALGAHGQTVRHRPDAGYTIQVNAPATLAELTGIDVVADFRSRDIAAGGQGAPLVPAFHDAMFRNDTARAVVNLGGICNLTGLPPAGTEQPVIGFDCGPGNVLIDTWAGRYLKEPMDRDGGWAASGRVDAGLLARLLAEPYFHMPPPKSTGRDLFNMHWLAQKLADVRVEPRDVQATLTRLTAVSIGDAVRQHFPQAADVLVCGGGAYNATLLGMIADECQPRTVTTTATLGIAPDQVEALAFAWLAREHLARRPANLPAVTGARRMRVLGALYPA